MDQMLFNSMTYTVAWANHIQRTAEQNTEQITSKMLMQYSKSFPEDDFKVDLSKSVNLLNIWLEESYVDTNSIFAWLNAFRLASVDWFPNGRRRGKPIFNGTFFTALRTKPLQRVDNFAKDTALYFAHINSGQIHGN